MIDFIHQLFSLRNNFQINNLKIINKTFFVNLNQIY